MPHEQEHTKRLVTSLQFNCGELMLNALNDSKVIEVMLNPDGNLWIERYGQDQELIGRIEPAQAKLILSLVASALGVTVSHLSPIVEGEFPLDGSRFEGVVAPIVSPGASFSIRKKASQIFTLEEYVLAGALTEQAANIIREAVIAHKNIVVVGGTSSGKTTFVNAIIGCISLLTPTDRLLILEDTGELQCKSSNIVFFRTSTIPGHEVSMRHLAKVCMRFAPKRIIVGEVRDAAALELLKLWNTGHPGGVGTFHADSAQEALERLEELIDEAGLGSKQKLIGRAIDLVVYMQKNAANKRIISSIINVNSFNSSTLTYETEAIYEMA